MSYPKCFMAAVLLCFLPSNLPFATGASQGENLDQEGFVEGRAWSNIEEEAQERAELAKQYYLKGLYEGLQMGFAFTSKEGLKQVYLLETNRERLVRALDQFYQDYRNEQISAILALQVISMELRGQPREEIDLELRRMRQEASAVSK